MTSSCISRLKVTSAGILNGAALCTARSTEVLNHVAIEYKTVTNKYHKNNIKRDKKHKKPLITEQHNKTKKLRE